MVRFNHYLTVTCRGFFLSVAAVTFYAMPVVSQVKTDVFWECDLEYQCPWGWKEFHHSVIFHSSFGGGVSASGVEGGELKIRPGFNNEYSFEISDNHCIRKGTLKYSSFAGMEYLRGELNTDGDNTAMWGTGLCCRGRIELRREVKKNPVPEVKQEKVKSLQKSASLNKGEKYILENVIFKLSSSELLPESYSELAHIYELLKTNNNMVVRLEGHTDIAGNHKSNKRLSEQRVKTIKNYLVKQGIEGKRIKLKWYGDKRPILTSGTVDERKVNRRVELVVLKTG